LQATIPRIAPLDWLDDVTSPANALWGIKENAAVVAVLAYALATMQAELPRKPQSVPDWLK
jgi:hypothetical protein